MPTQPCNSNAEFLKSQGNELYQKGQYQAAQRKFTDAIKEDPTNAIYYANRAASCLALKEYLDAAADAIKATKLDPNYSKAWSRLASATYGLGSWAESIHAWEMALECLPLQKQSLETEEKLRNQFTDGLKKSQTAMITPQKISGIYVKQGQKMPWEKAAALIQEFADARKISSGFVILQAYGEFKEGVEVMKQITKHCVNGMTTWLGKPDALVNITNGIMRDPRSFHIDCPDWILKFNEQVIFEAQFFKAWVHGGSKTIKEEAFKLLKQSGWDAVKPALSTTVRAWLMCGLMATLRGQYQTSMEYYSRVVDVLDWGSHIWQNVPTRNRGVIFERTFIRGAKRLQLSAMHTCITKKVNNLNFTINDMVVLCHKIITETDANPPSAADGELDVGFMASFWMYPKGEALSFVLCTFLRVYWSSLH
ncbi:hypothetical protein HYPSUDRAFT_62222 [Hypholoma sublateritium FD-334 SS-4]|uniref:Uncharacterized protein n=1 Tax=Hypholoma sublateritium (strain FD-334 SS-4) TaxID=945553 RepID=A0A0D2QAD2_HYPSF|nr:hypothetical protein HYPSUDRAFT_62222 [Hypholoma sublateritium FD-334 SS-4]